MTSDERLAHLVTACNQVGLDPADAAIFGKVVTVLRRL